MKIRLPKEFEYHEGAVHASVKDGTLQMTHAGFEEVMYALTYEIRGKEKCYYCGKELTDTTKTLDHVFPRDFGGVSITNNLLPCCKSCNEEKSNLLPQQYRQLRPITGKLERSLQIEVFQYKNFQARKEKGIILPEKWYEMLEKYTVFAPIISEHNFRNTPKYLGLQEKYEIYGKICRPIVISENRIVLDGFAALLLAKNLGLKEPIPFMILDNVTVIL